MRGKKSIFLISLLILSTLELIASDDKKMSDESNLNTLPEHEVRPLPKDTFRPSEKVSEDFPVNFPVDI